MKRLLLLLFTALVLSPAVLMNRPTLKAWPSTDSLTPSKGSVESELKAAFAGGKVPPHLSVFYSDMHGLWGGTSIVIRGRGTGERRERSRGKEKPKVVKKRIDQGQLLELIKLLIELRAWEQQTPDRPPLPDESRATLSISVNGQASESWEWFNEISKNNRLIQIKTKMLGLK